MVIKCPHCGMEYDARQGDFGKTRTCEGCNSGFKINTAYICPQDGTITWFDSAAMEGMGACGGFGVLLMSFIGPGFAFWAFCSVASQIESPFLTDALLEWLFRVGRTWQGITGLISSILGFLLVQMSHPGCSKCDTREGLLDLNSPMGWKLYKNIYGDE